MKRRKKPHKLLDPRTVAVVNAAGTPDELRIVGASEGFELLAEEPGEPGKVKLKKFSMTAYTGAAMNVGFGWPVVVDLEGMQVSGQAKPILMAHDTGRIVGHTSAIDVTSQRVKVSGVISGVGEAAQEVVALAANGFPWQASIGAAIRRMEFVDRGESVKVNGRSFTGPVYVARQTVLGEVSFVPIGADSNTSANVAAQPGGVNPMFEKWLKARGYDVAKLTEGERNLLKAAFDYEQANPPAVVAGNPPTPSPTPAPAFDLQAETQRQLEAMQRSAAAEIVRQNAIRSICAAEPDLETEIEENGTKRKVNILAHAIASGWTKDQTELAVLRAARPVVQGGLAFVADGAGLQQQEQLQAMEAALCLSANLPEKSLAKHYSEKVLNAATGQHFRGTKISTVIHATIAAAGMRAAHGNVSDATIRMAIQADKMIRASGGFSTVSLAGILSAVANKAMIAAYEAQAVVWPMFAATRNHGDFKVHTRYRLDSTGSFKKVAPTGELEHVGLDEASYTNQLDTYGAIIALNRQMMLNDDLGAFLQIPTFLGRMSNIRVEEALFVLLLSNPGNFFHSSNKNLITGGGGAMTAANGIAAITAAEQKFSDLVDSNGKPVLIPPDRMLLGTANYIPARNIYEGRVKITGASQTEVNNNEHAGKYTPFKSPYVNNTAITDQDGEAITGQSSTVWWLFANPAVRAAMAVAFLNGVRVPVIESADTVFDTLGMQWRSYIDFGVGMEDPVAAVQVNGA